MLRGRYELSGHDARLQSLRGLAALAVLVGHATLICPPTTYSIAIGAVFEQDSAVIFFYVLSGFVLSAKLRREPFAWPRWIGDRSVRLLPVFWASIVYAIPIMLSLLQHPHFAGASQWFNGSLNFDASLGMFADNFSAYSPSLNGTLWSVQVELCAVIFFPLLVFLIDRLSLRANALVLAALLIVTQQALLPWALQSPSLFSRSIGYIYCFYIGALLPYAMVHRQGRDLLGNGALVLIGLAGAIYLRYGMVYGLVSSSTKFVADALVGAQVIAYVAGRVTPADRLLLRPAIMRLGDISYSFYAIGQVTLLACAFLLFVWLPAGFYRAPFGAVVFSLLSALLAFAVIWPIAMLSHRVLEVGLRKKLTSPARLRPSAVATEPVSAA
jgi:peptidoglycan/LPS O-acetylase OafA/YrhL